MSLGRQVGSDRQLVRLLQIGAVLEELVEARAHRHVESLSSADDVDGEVREFLREAAAESSRHCRMLEDLIDDLDADTVPYDQVEALVREGYTASTDFDGLLYDQLCNEETAYKFYDDLIAAIEESDARFEIDRQRVLDVLRTIREEEADGVEAVTDLMERHG